MLLAESLLGSSSAAEFTFVEDVFSTWLYTGNGSAQGIPNGIQLGAGATTPGWFSLGNANVDSAPDASGNVYAIAGNTLIKYSSAGAPLWQRRLVFSFSSTYNNVIVDSNGDICVSGILRDPANSNSYPLIVIKYNSSGTLLWQIVYKITNSEFKSCKLVVDASNNLYALGSRVSVFGGMQTAVLVKYNSSGTFQWARQLDTPNNTPETLFQLAVDSSGNCVTAIATGSPLISLNITRIDTNGTALWQRQINSPNSDYNVSGPSVGIDTSGNIYVGHSERSSSDPDTNGISVRKFNSSGTLQWTRSVTGFEANLYFFGGRALAVDSSDRVYALAGAYNTPAIDGIRIIRLNADNTVSYARGMGGAATATTTSDIAFSIRLDNFGNFYVSGSVTTAASSEFFTAKLPIDGSGQGVYGNVFYSTQSTSGIAAYTVVQVLSTPTLSSATNGTTAGAGTDEANTLTYTLAVVPEGPGKGGLVWMKGRSTTSFHGLYDTARGATFEIGSDSTTAQTTQSQGLTSFLANGFSIGSRSNLNSNAATYASWTFREQPKFFDVVTYVGNGVAGRQIAHSLGSVPGCMFVKRTDASADWIVYHRSLSSINNVLFLNSTSAEFGPYSCWNGTAPTATNITLGDRSDVNANGGTYVAYLFAHDAGGFGATGADNVISCGSFTTDGSGNATVNLGYEPQWIMYKRAVGGTGNWTILDTMRGWPVGGNDAQLQANTSGAETSAANVSDPNATGFSVSGISASSTFIYIAIRRGPMRTPTSGTQVFSPIASSAATGTTLTTSFPVDMQITTARSTTASRQVVDRLRGISTNATGAGQTIYTNSTFAEVADAGSSQFWDNTGFQMPLNWGGVSDIFWNFRRAPGFFDVVCYTGTGASPQVTSHNLGVVPELVISKVRSNGDSWIVGFNFGASTYNRITLNSTGAAISLSYGSGSMFGAIPTSSTLSWDGQQASGRTYVAYLFASCPGVSKVGSYTGTGSTQTINCGFAAGARFVLIKRTDSTGDWYVWDSARGIVAANDPYLRLNSTAAEVTNTDWVDTAASGFELSNAAGNLVNTNGASYIFLAIA